MALIGDTTLTGGTILIGHMVLTGDLECRFTGTLGHITPGIMIHGMAPTHMVLIHTDLAPDQILTTQEEKWHTESDLAVHPE